MTSKKGLKRAEPEQAVVAHLVNDRGLQFDHDDVQGAECHSALHGHAREAERCPALQNPAGRIVFVNRKTAPAHAARIASRMAVLAMRQPAG
ncbi:MAG: hypothetical protein P4N24_18110 [Acidobacteriota bacterium]|nr:hypothetical protein [Acidobacteriota bacterium]